METYFFCEESPSGFAGSVLEVLVWLTMVRVLFQRISAFVSYRPGLSPMPPQIFNDDFENSFESLGGGDAVGIRAHVGEGFSGNRDVRGLLANEGALTLT